MGLTVSDEFVVNCSSFLVSIGVPVLFKFVKTGISILLLSVEFKQEVKSSTESIGSVEFVKPSCIFSDIYFFYYRFVRIRTTRFFIPTTFNLITHKLFFTFFFTSFSFRGIIIWKSIFVLFFLWNSFPRK